MTLGDLQDAGKVPSTYQIFILECEESKKCSFCPHPHLYHDFALTSGKVKRQLCEKVENFRTELNRMFPSLKVVRKDWRLS